MRLGLGLLGGVAEVGGVPGAEAVAEVDVEEEEDGAGGVRESALGVSERRGIVVEMVRMGSGVWMRMFRAAKGRRNAVRRALRHAQAIVVHSRLFDTDGCSRLW